MSTTKVFCPTVFSIDGHEFANFQFIVLPHFKGSNIILGLPPLKKLNVVIHPRLNSFTLGDFTIQCDRELRRISCLIVDTDKMNQIIAKHARNKKDPVDVFLRAVQNGFYNTVEYNGKWALGNGVPGNGVCMTSVA